MYSIVNIYPRGCETREQLLFLNLLFLLGYRIVKVDLKFPLKPFVSPAAKDLISQVRSLHFFPLVL